MGRSQSISTTGNARPSLLEPFTKTLLLSWKKRVVNSMGVEVCRSTQQNAGKADLQLGRLPRGTYWLRLSAGGVLDSRAFVLE